MPFTFEELLERRRGKEFKFPERMLVLDPGETTGWAVFEHGRLTAWGQIKTMEEGWDAIHELFADVQPTHVLYENYRIYKHKLERHSFSDVYTLRLIGVIEYLCDVTYGVPRVHQMAQQAKGFVKDQRLREWGYFKPGMRHARDAIRHGCYYLLFDKELKSL